MPNQNMVKEFRGRLFIAILPISGFPLTETLSLIKLHAGSSEPSPSLCLNFGPGKPEHKYNF